MFEEEKPSGKETLKDRILTVAENIDDIPFNQLRSIYEEISKDKMERKIRRKARIITAKDTYHEWVDTRSKERAKKKGKKLEGKMAKVKKKLNK